MSLVRFEQCINRQLWRGKEGVSKRGEMMAKPSGVQIPTTRLSHTSKKEKNTERERVCVCMSVWVCEREQSMVVKAERQCCCRHQHHYQQQQQLSFLSILLNERERERIFYFWSYLVPFTHYQKCKKQNEEKVFSSKQKISSSQKLRAQVTYKNSLLYLYRKFNR